MEDIEITLDDKTADWAHASAAAKGQTVSDFIAELIRKRRDDEDYTPARSPRPIA